MRNMIKASKAAWSDACASLVTAVLTVLALRWGVGPQTFDIAVPFSYSGDGLSHGVLIKSLLEEGWFPAFNAHLGAPFVAAQFDYPATEALHYIILKAIGLLSHDWARVENIYVLTGFALTAASAYLVLKALGIDRALGVAGGVVYALLPYHMLRIEHPFLAAYFCVPLAIWLVLTLLEQRAAPNRLPLTSRAASWRTGLAAVIVGACGVYYATFALMLVILAAVISLVRAGGRPNFVRSVAVSSIILATVTATIIPTMWYRAKQGTNPEAVQRAAAESERYGLTLTELVLPRPGHRNTAARAIAQRYHAQSSSNLERETAALGIVSTIGFVLLSIAVFCGVIEKTRTTMLDHLGIVLLVCFIVGTIGGLGSVIAWTVTPLIRAYSRISVFIAFCSIAALLMWLQALFERLITSHRARALASTAAASMLIAIGVLDQTSPSDFQRGAAARAFASDRDFVRQAESLLPPGAAIYQLPYHPYPEAGPLHAMADYDLFRGYLHSSNLRWSHGNMRGRSGDAWRRHLSQYSIPLQIAAARENGFRAVYVDRRGFADQGTAIESEIHSLAGAPELLSSDGNIALYDIANVSASAEQLPQWGDLLDLGEADVQAVALSSFASGEGWGRWTLGEHAHLVFMRPLPPRFAVELQIVAAFPPNVGAQFTAQVGNTVRTFTVANVPCVVRLEFDSRGDGHSVTLNIPKPVSPAAAGVNGNDKRLLGLGIKHVRIVPLPNIEAPPTS